MRNGWRQSITNSVESRESQLQRLCECGPSGDWLTAGGDVDHPNNRLNPDFANGKSRNLQQIKALLSSPGNGLDDIYWVKFDTDWLK